MNSSGKPEEKKSLLQFLKLLKPDIYFFMVTFGFYMQMITIIQLAEDKMCLNQLEKSKEFCLTLTANHSNDPEARLIFIHANEIRTWQTVIIYVPATIMSMFFGYWLDKYPYYMKKMMMAPCVGAIIQTILLLLNAYFFKINSWAIVWSYAPYSLSGASVILQSVFATYISWSTPKEWLGLRFAIQEIVFSLGYLGGTLAGGYMLSRNPMIPDQIENYFGVFASSLVLFVIALTFGLIIKLENVPKISKEFKNISHGQVFRDVFTFGRLKELIKPLTVKRAHSGRLKLNALTLVAVIYYGIWSGDDVITLQFSQQIYKWEAAKFSKLFSSINLVPVLFTLLAAQVIKLFSLGSGAIGLLGSVSLFVGNVLHGTCLNETGFILTYILGGFNPLINVGLRSLVTTIVQPNETGQVFAILTSLCYYAIIFCSLVYTIIYNATLSSQPSLIYKCASIVLLFPIFTFLWAELSWITNPQKDIEKDDTVCGNNFKNLTGNNNKSIEQSKG